MKFATSAEEKAYHAGLAARDTQRDAQSAPVEFRKNAQGSPEYASMILTMDHLSGPSETGHYNTKLVLSTEDTETALRSLFDYYGERERLFNLNSTLDMLVENRMNPNRGVFLYIVPSEVKDRFGNLIVQVVLSTDLFSALTHHPDFGAGSEFVLIQALALSFSKILADVQAARGGEFPPLSYVNFEGRLAVMQEEIQKVAE